MSPKKRGSGIPQEKWVPVDPKSAYSRQLRKRVTERMNDETEASA